MNQEQEMGTDLKYTENNSNPNQIGSMALQGM